MNCLVKLLCLFLGRRENQGSLFKCQLLSIKSNKSSVV